MKDGSADDGLEIFWELHRGFPRQGPGSNECTRRAFHAAGTLPRHPAVADVGCGPGMQTLELARLLRSRVVAVDNHEPFLAELRERAHREGLADFVEARLGDLHDLPFDPQSLDLLWSEGAIYIVGFQQGLHAWRSLLRPKGVLTVTEAAWLRPDAPEEVRRFWDEAYPAMDSREGNARSAAKSGYRVLEHFALPSEAWRTHYYIPLGDAISRLRERYSGDSEALEVLASEAREIEMFEKYHEYYGYVFYVLAREA